MFSYINSIILKGESDNDNTQKQSNTDNQNAKKCHDHSEKTIKTDKYRHDKSSKGKLDPFMQRIMFPLYLDYQSQNDKLLREETNSSNQSEISQSEKKLDWTIFTPSNMPIVNTEKESGETKQPNRENINVRPRTNEDMLAFIETLQ